MVVWELLLGVMGGLLLIMAGVYTVTLWQHLDVMSRPAILDQLWAVLGCTFVGSASILLAIDVAGESLRPYFFGGCLVFGVSLILVRVLSEL